MKIPGHFTTHERKKILWELYNSHENSDQSIAERLNLKIVSVRMYTTWHSEKRIESLNRKVNERYRERKITQDKIRKIKAEGMDVLLQIEKPKNSILDRQVKIIQTFESRSNIDSDH